MALETPPTKDDATMPYQHLWAHGVSRASDLECIIDQNGNFCLNSGDLDYLCVIIEWLPPPVTPAAREDAPSSYEHCRPCDVVMEGGESAFSLTIGVGTGSIMRSRVGCYSSLVRKRRGGNKVKAVVRRSRQESATVIAPAPDKVNLYVIELSLQYAIHESPSLFHEGTLVYFSMRFVGGMS